MPLTEDFSEFFDDDEFATEATYLGETIYGIFTMPFVLIGDRESRQPRFYCAASDVPSVTNESQITIEGTIYDVITPEPDGTGLIALDLHEA